MTPEARWSDLKKWLQEQHQQDSNLADVFKESSARLAPSGDQPRWDVLAAAWLGALNKMDELEQS